MRNFFEGDALERLAELSFAPPRSFNWGHRDTASLQRVGMVQASKGDAPLKSGIEIAKDKRGSRLAHDWSEACSYL